MDILSLLILILLVSWIVGALGAPAPAGNVVWIIVVIAIVLMLGGGYSGYHSGYFWHR